MERECMNGGKLISVNVGMPREITWRREMILTSIFKEPVAGSVRVGKQNIEGDGQSDLNVHGGMLKAVYVYPSEHYPFWRSECPDLEFPWGAFGENLTTRGLLEKDVAIGDRLTIGAVELVVTQPRLPCFKLGIRFGRAGMVKRFLKSGMSGFYCAVVNEGMITSGDTIEHVRNEESSMTVFEIYSLYTDKKPDAVLLQKASTIASLPDRWQRHFREMAG